MLGMAAVNSILERRDTIIIASVACIYGASNPEQYREMFFSIRVGDIIDRKELMGKLVARQYTRNDMDLLRGTFRVRGDVIEVAPGRHGPLSCESKCLMMKSKESVKWIP